MKFEIPMKAVLSVAVPVLLGVASWFALGHIEHGNRLTTLEGSGVNDARQDSELTELRATIRDLIRLTAELSGHAHAPVGPLVSEPDVGAGPPELVAEEAVDALEGEYGEFRTEQADLESILRERGIAPAEKTRSGN